MKPPFEIIQVIDTHTGGEPTRVVIDSPIELSGETLADQRSDFAARYDDYRRAIVCEPRGSDVMVGALLTQPVNPESVAGVIFFNNVGYLGMCGHGTIGLAIALEYQGKITKGKYQLDTPVGTVGFEMLNNNKVAIENVPSYRLHRQIAVTLGGARVVHGDVAWGGNWFFLCDDHGLDIEPGNLEALASLSAEIRKALPEQGITGSNSAEIDHIELMGPPSSQDKADARNYVMCPGAAYDRSPCGTGTSAKIACMAADGQLQPTQIHRQESVVGSVFETTYRTDESASSPEGEIQILPRIVGEAFVTADAKLTLDFEDPFGKGIAT
ncbi:MAG: proline racemase family protein [Planctomycetota bacterium]|nr:proline racemase family protein [Planctomycetota bacterium]